MIEFEKIDEVIERASLQVECERLARFLGGELYEEELRDFSFHDYSLILNIDGYKYVFESRFERNSFNWDEVFRYLKHEVADKEESDRNRYLEKAQKGMFIAEIEDKVRDILIKNGIDSEENLSCIDDLIKLVDEYYDEGFSVVAIG